MRWMITGGFSFLVACAGPAADDGPTGSTDDPTGDSGGTDGVTDESKKVGTRFDGTIVDAAGAPIEGVSIRFCQAICLTDDTDAEGRFGFPVAPSGWTAFEAVPDSPTTAVGYVPVEIVEDVDRDVTMVLPELDAAHTIPASPTELEVGRGLFVTVSDDDLEPPIFVDDATQTAGVLLTEAQHPPLDFAEGDIVAIWYMTPFDHHSKAGMAVEFDNQWKLKDGEVYAVWQGSYVDQSWVDAGRVTVKGKRLSGDARLPLMSTTMLVGPVTE